MLRPRIALCLALAADSAAGCSSEEPATVTIVVTAGLESDATTREPVPARLELHAVSPAGNNQKMLDIAWPSGGFSIGDYDPNQVLAFEARGKDATGQVVLRGATIFHALWVLGNDDVPLFVGRVHELSRPSGALPISRVGGVAAIVNGRFVVSSGGSQAVYQDGTSADPSTFTTFDLGTWTASSARATLTRSPRSLVISQGRFGLAIDDSGASWFDFATSGNADAAVPNGLDFAEIAGGSVIYGEDESYVVGPTRSADEPSSAVLRVAHDGTLSVARLGTPRSGVAATYVAGRGLVLVGGHPTEPGVLLLQPDATSFASLAYPPDGIQGAGAADVDGERILLAGGRDGMTDAPTRWLDLTCTGNCKATELGAGLAPVAIDQAWARATRTDEVVVVGPSDDATASTRFVRIGGLNTIPFVETVALREPRIGAVALPLFGRAIALVGGQSPNGKGVFSVEVYIPE